MTPVAAIGFSICLLILGASFRRGADMLSPARVFGAVWALTIGLADLKLSRLQHVWPAESWVVVLMGPVCFLAGLFAVWAMYLHLPSHGLEGVRAAWKGLTVHEGRLFQAGCVLFALFVVGFLAIVASGKEIPVFSARPGKARLAFQLFGLGLFLHNAVLIALVTLLYILKVRGRRVRRWLLIGMSVVSILLYGLTLQRFQIVMTAILCLTLLYYTTRHLRPVTIGAYGMIAAVFFLAISTLRSGQLFIAYLYLDSRMTFDPQYAVLTEPYMYFAMNVENFARGAERLQDLTFGIFTLDFIAALSGIKHWLREYLALTDTPFLISGYNTYSFFWTYYRDFGIAGLATLSWALGVVVGLLYHAMRTRPTVKRVVWYVWAVFIMIFSFYLNPLTFLWFVYDLIALAVVLHIITVPEPTGGKVDVQGCAA